ncbi:MAG: hypothetical protein MJA84_05170, partial [Firmicutes bacterium]|nr:hypothetical protein [Bacillota bacterium]
MAVSDELNAIIDAIPKDFADPSADYHAVRKTFAPFHGHAVSDGFSVQLTRLGGVSCGQYEFSGASSELLAF